MCWVLQYKWSMECQGGVWKCVDTVVKQFKIREQTFSLENSITQQYNNARNICPCKFVCFLAKDVWFMTS